MGAAASILGIFSKQRYIGGKQPAKYFHEDCWPIMEELFEKLGIDEILGTKIFIAFCSMDADESGTADVDECFAHFGGKRTRFNERLFHHEEKLVRQAGDLHRGFNFKEFSIRVWNYNTYTTEQLCRCIFEIFDIDREGFVERAEVESMYRMLYDCDDPDPEYIGNVPYEDDVIKKADFEKYFSDFWRTGSGHLVFPAIEFQKRLRSRTGGSLAWDSVTKFRKQNFHVYDDMAKIQEEALAGILAAEDLNKKKKLEDAERILELERLRLKAIADKAQKDLEEREAQIKRELAAREAIAPDRFMKKAFKDLERKLEAFTDIDFTLDDIWQRSELRNELYQYYDNYQEEARKFYTEQDEKVYEIAVGSREDHMFRLEDYLKTNEGQSHSRRNLLRMIYTVLDAEVEEKRIKNQGRRKKDTRTVDEMLIQSTLTEIQDHIKAIETYEEYKAKLKVISKDEAMELQIIKPVVLKDFTSEYNFVKKLLSTSKLKEYEEINKEELYNLNRNKVLEECQDGLDADRKQRERELMKHEFSIMKFGSRTTRWEYVRDKINARDVIINVDTLQILHYKTAICEKCDAVFEQSELKCKICKAGRSPKNMNLYRPLGHKDVRTD